MGFKGARSYMSGPKSVFMFTLFIINLGILRGRQPGMLLIIRMHGDGRSRRSNKTQTLITMLT